nr:males-absent on the first protein [Drosophila takahashii]
MSQGEQDHNEVNQVEKDQLMDQNEKAAGSAENLKTLLGALKLVPRVPTPEIQVADTNIDCSLLTKNNEDDSGNGPEIKQEETSSECSWLTVNSEDTSSECSWLTINSEDTSFVNVPNPEGVSIPSQEKIQNHSKISENAEKEMSISPQSLDFSPLQNDIFPEEDIQKNQEMKGSFDYPILESNKLAKTIGSDTLLEDDKSKERLLRLPQKTLETSSIERQKELKKMEVNDDIYYIKRDDGSVHEGRLLKFRKSENPVMPDEYYVRYIGFNKKLDAWVGVHRISDKAEDLGGLKAGQMKNTPSAYRLQKRKNKEQEYQPMKNIERVQFGRYEIETWYFSPYPKEYGKASIIYVCEFCLKYMKLRKSYAYHLSDCKKRTPPGSLIYQKDDIYIYEVDGNEQKLYCQCLELFSKLFLENKDFFYDPSPFFFYIMCVKDQDGQHFVGYFARDRDSEDNFNVACILVLPPHQRKGYGKLLIALSYEISRREGFIGGPEKPLSAFGRLCYRGYWGYTLLELLRNHSSPEPITIRELSETTGFLKEDILYTLKVMKMIKYYGDDYLVCTMREIIEERLKLPQLRKPKLTIDPKCFLWKAKT